jgi:hypothetical protein
MAQFPPTATMPDGHVYVTVDNFIRAVNGMEPDAPVRQSQRNALYAAIADPHSGVVGRKFFGRNRWHVRWEEA